MMLFLGILLGGAIVVFLYKKGKIKKWNKCHRENLKSMFLKKFFKGDS